MTIAVESPGHAGPRPRVAAGGAGRWLAAQVEAERERWVLWLPVAFAAGIGVYFGLPQEPPLWLGPSALALCVAAGVATRRAPAIALCAVAAAAICAGFAAAQLRTAVVAAPVLEKRIGPVPLAGEVLSAQPRLNGQRLVLHRLETYWRDPVLLPKTVRITVGANSPTVRPGDWIRLRAVLRPPPDPAAPGAYDFGRRAYFQGLGGVGFAMGRIDPIPPPPDAQATNDWLTAWRLWWADLRFAIAQRVLDTLPGPSGAVAAALMTGERGAIPAATMQAMRDSGLAHLLAISGLHMGLVAGLLFVGLRGLLALVPRLALTYPIKKWAALAAVAGAFVYLLLTGATIPTQRAFLMVGLALLAVTLDRTVLSLRLVAWAAVATLAIAPESLLSASFQLSFAAVTALVAGYEIVRDRRGHLFAERGLWTRIALYFAGIALTSVIANLATAPFAAAHFNRIAWFGLAANLIAVPLTALWIMPWAIVAFLLLPFGAEQVALVPMGWGIDAMLAVAESVAAWPGAVGVVRAMPAYGLILIALGGVWLCLWRRPWRLAGLGPILAGALSIAASPPPDLLASGDGKLFAIRGSDGALLVSTEKSRKFDADVWRRRLGLRETEAWPSLGEVAGGRLRCDPLGCLYRTGEHVVALVQDSRALRDDCAVATLVISRVPVRRGTCPGGAMVIDRFDLWRHGAHALWLAPDGVRIETVGDRRGRRPWTPKRGRE